MKFLIEALQDLDNKFRKLGGQLYLFRGNPVTIFRRLWEEFGIRKICFEQDCEPIWQSRDEKVFRLCREIGVECVEKVSHTLWDPNEIIEANGGMAPLTYQMFVSEALIFLNLLLTLLFQNAATHSTNHWTSTETHRRPRLDKRSHGKTVHPTHERPTHVR